MRRGDEGERGGAGEAKADATSRRVEPAEPAVSAGDPWGTYPMEPALI